MRTNRKASLEIGVNTIVILVVAMIILGLAIGFVRGIFSKANDLPDVIDTSNIRDPPSANNLVTMYPKDVATQSGATSSTSIDVALFNNQVNPAGLTINSNQWQIGCVPRTGGGSVTLATVSALGATILPGKVQGFKIIVAPNVGWSASGSPYLCSLSVTTSPANIFPVKQFTWTIS